MTRTIYTYGYQGSTPEDLLQHAREHSAIVIDIRYNPTSQDKRWTQDALRKLLGNAYAWCGNLGNKNYRGGPIVLQSPAAGLDWVTKHFTPWWNIILLCGCRDAESCHRSVAADLISHKTGAPVVHLPSYASRPGTYPVISLTPPWGTLIVIGAKRFETRDWGTTYRGPLLIHQTKGLAGIEDEDELQDICFNTEYFKTALEEAGYTHASELPRGAIIGKVELYDCWPITATNAPSSRQERAFGNYTPGRKAWELDSPVRFAEPIPARGLPGIWSWTLPEVEQ